MLLHLLLLLLLLMLLQVWAASSTGLSDLAKEEKAIASVASAAVSLLVASDSLLDCSADQTWTLFRLKLSEAAPGVLERGSSPVPFMVEDSLAELAYALVDLVEQQGMMQSVEVFYQDLCSSKRETFCLYGAVNALFLVAAHLHQGASLSKNEEDFRVAQEYLKTAKYLLGSQHSLDFMESSAWPIHTSDLLQNTNRSKQLPFAWAPRVQAGVATSHNDLMHVFDAPRGSTLAITSLQQVAAHLAFLGHSQLVEEVGQGKKQKQNQGREEARFLAVGTHPTLTLEAVTMLKTFAVQPGLTMRFLGTLGIAYKCGVFPEMCQGGAAADNAGAGDKADPIARLIGRFDAPPSYESYSFARIKSTMEELAMELRGKLELFVCTSPFIICALLQQATNLPMLGYLGLPLLWKRPTDYFEKAGEQFWGALRELRSKEHVVLFVNNPLLAEQIAFQSPGEVLPVIRPHALFTNASYAPSRRHEAMLVSRTKFMWVTFACAIRHFTLEGYPIKFTVANSDSKYSFQEMAAHLAVVLIPWEHALMAFFEYYSMAVPTMMPEAHWAYRLAFDPEGNLGSTTSEYFGIDPTCPEQGCTADDGRRHHPFPPFGFESLESRRYWYQYSSFEQFPHIIKFSSIPDLLNKLVTTDLRSTTAAMKAFNQETLARSVAAWRSARARLLPLQRESLPLAAGNSD